MKKILLLLFIIFSIPVAASTSYPLMNVTLESCDDDGDGSAEFDLVSAIPDILAGMNATDFAVTFHSSNEDALAGSNDIDSNLMYTSSDATIFSRIEEISDPLNFSIGRVELNVNESPSTRFPDDIIYELCPNSKVALDVRTYGNNYNRDRAVFQWYKDGQAITGETNQRIRIIEAGFYELEVTYNSSGCSSIDGFTVEEVQNCVVPQGISPNGDGINDSFDLTDFRVSNIQIFNRYGKEVFSSSNYTNEWRGQTEDGEDLPVGTYFYTMVYKEGQKTSGWVYIQREK